MSRMHNHAGFLVQHQHILILMYNIQRNRFRKDFKTTTLIRHHKRHNIPRTDNVVGLDNLFIYTDILCLDGKLNTMTGGVLHMRREVLVHTHRDLTGSDVKPVMFKHLLLFVLIRHLKDVLLKIHVLHYSPSSTLRYTVTSVPILTEKDEVSGACLYTTAFKLSS